jgi:hypothetical protein
MTDEKPRKKLSLKRKPAAAKEDGALSTETNKNGDEVKEFVRGKKRVLKMQSAAAKKAEKDSLLSPAERQSRELKRIMAETFSVWRRRRPLAIGIDDQIAAFVAEKDMDYSKRAIKKLLRRHAKHKSYLQNVARGGVRFDLDGTEAGKISPEEQDYARRALEEPEKEKKR